MAKKLAKPVVRQEMSGIERLNLRVSSMINHPIAQDQRWVTIHRMDTDGDREWEEVLSVLSEADGIEMILNDEDESITLKWEAQEESDPVAHEDDDLRVKCLSNGQRKARSLAGYGFGREGQIQEARRWAGLNECGEEPCL